MAKENLGKVMMTLKGEYDASLSYEILDIVSYNGNSYVSRVSNNTNDITDTAYWQLIAEKGEKGDVAIEDFNELENTVNTINADVTNLETDTSTLKTDVTDLQTDMEEVQGNIDTINTDTTNKFNGNSSMGSIVVEDITCKNLFDKNNATILSAYIDGGVIKSVTTASTFYIKCEPNTTYTVSKTPGQRFSVGYMKDVPTIGATLSSYVRQDTSSSITIRTNETANYIVVWYYSGSYDTITEAQMRSSIQVEKGSVATDYVEHKEFSNKQVYSTNEVKIGTWLGKPLYRTVLEIEKTTAGDKAYTYDLSNVDQVAFIYGTLFTDNAYVQIPYYIKSSNYLVPYTIPSQNSIGFNAPTDGGTGTIKLIIEYTKTTDVSTTSLDDTE